MGNIVRQLPIIIGAIVVIVGMAILSQFVNKYHQKKRLEGKIKAGLVNEDGTPKGKTEEEKKAEMEAALEIGRKLTEKKDKE